MRKLHVLLLLVTVAFSCSEFDDNHSILHDSELNSDEFSRPSQNNPIRLDPTKLARVINFPGQFDESQIYFFPNGLVKKIVNFEGALIWDFIYDANQNLLTVHKYGNGGFTFSFTYDSNNHIISANGVPVSFDGIAGAYLIDPDFVSPGYYLDKTRVLVNAEGILTTEERLYQNANDEEGDPDTVEGVDTFINFGDLHSISNHFMYYTYTEYTYLETENPLKAAFLPACRSLAIVNFGSISNKLLLAKYLSQHNLSTIPYDGPEYDVFQYQYNSLGLPTTQTRMRYYTGWLESTMISAAYYYQGDLIPN
jgi:hypothetical protein